MKIFAVIDTNVLVSALLKPASIPGLVMRETLAGRLIPLLNQKIIEEYIEVLHRPKFHFDSGDVKALIDGLTARALCCNPKGNA